jgi:hypothetical protein
MTDSLLSELPFQEKKNPLNATYKPMRLYLQQHVRWHLSSFPTLADLIM